MEQNEFSEGQREGMDRHAEGEQESGKKDPATTQTTRCWGGEVITFNAEERAREGGKGQRDKNANTALPEPV